jgi:hypothetical protein
LGDDLVSNSQLILPTELLFLLLLLCFLLPFIHSFAHSSGISSQKEHPVTGNSPVKADSEGVEHRKLKEDAVLVVATVGREGDVADG